MRAPPSRPETQSRPQDGLSQHWVRAQGNRAARRDWATRRCRVVTHRRQSGSWRSACNCELLATILVWQCWSDESGGRSINEAVFASITRVPSWLPPGRQNCDPAMRRPPRADGRAPRLRSRSLARRSTRLASVVLAAVALGACVETAMADDDDWKDGVPPGSIAGSLPNNGDPGGMRKWLSE